MSTAHVPPNAGGTGGNESTEDEITIRTRLFYPLFGIAVIVGVILDVFILILLNTYVPGRARTPFWIFIIPIAVLVFLVSFVDDVLAKHFPNLVPEELRRQLAVAEAAKAAGATQQQGYLQVPGNPMQAQAAPQYRPHPGTAPAQQSGGQPQYGQPAAQSADQSADHCPSHPTDCRVGRGARAACSWFSLLGSGLIPHAVRSCLDRQRIGRLYEPTPAGAARGGEVLPTGPRQPHLSL